AIADYYRGDLGAAEQPLHELIRDAHAHLHNLVEGRSLRMRGLLNGLGGKLADSLDDYRAALVAFDRVNAREDLAAIHWVLSDRLVTIGDTTTAWQHVHEALRNLDAVQHASPRNGILFGAGSTARKQGALQAALAFQSEFLDRIPHGVDSIDAPQAYLARAEIGFQLGDVDRAAADVREAQTLVERIDDVNVRERMRAEADLALAEVTSGIDEVEPLTSTLAYFESKGMKQRLLRVYEALGRIHLQAGDTARAEAMFRRGVSLLEAERALLPAGQVRIGYYDQPWNLYDDLIDVLASSEKGRVEALQVAEHARARDLRESAGDARIEDPQAVGRALPAGTVLVYFVLLDRRLLTWTLERNGIRAFDEPVDRTELVNDANDFATAIRELRDADVERLSEHLFEHLFQPILAEVAGATTIAVAADGPLHALPFGALKDPTAHRYLVEDHVMVAAPSATVFSRATAKLRAARPLQTARVFVITNPTLDPHDRSDLPNLPSAEEEGRDIKALYPGATVLTGGAATKARFAAAGEFDIVHFAGHAVANDQYPLLSRLLFAREADGRPGTMFAHELLGMNFQNTELVVLAGCRTGAGAIRRAEGPMSLARPFLARGVPIVIATLWDVTDRSTAPIVNALYAGLRSGSAPGEALRNAQLMLLHHADPDLRRPAAWAAFVNFGGVS
ncbi:MAG TPA: CHAT domain-containing protein, partial [Rhodanobacteraceae bacterium]